MTKADLERLLLHVALPPLRLGSVCSGSRLAAPNVTRARWPSGNCDYTSNYARRSASTITRR